MAEPLSLFSGVGELYCFAQAALPEVAVAFSGDSIRGDNASTRDSTG